jgi:hypothetical protein
MYEYFETYNKKSHLMKDIKDGIRYHYVSFYSLNTIMYFVARYEVWIGNRIYWTLIIVTTNNYGSLTELHTPKVTVTKAHIKSFQSSLAVA